MSVNTYDKNTGTLSEVAGGRVIVDPVPTENSVRPVSSNGVFEALEGKADFVDLGTYDSRTYPTDTDFVNAIASKIKSLFGNDGNAYANITYIRGGSWVGTMEYSPYQNGYISILAHIYQSNFIVHFGTTNGVPFYDNLNHGATFTTIGTEPISLNDHATITRKIGEYVANNSIIGTSSAYLNGLSYATITSGANLNNGIYYINASLPDIRRIYIITYNSSNGTVLNASFFNGEAAT